MSSSSPPGAAFAVCVELAESHAVLRVRGAVESSNASALAAIVDAVVAQTYRTVDFDLTEVFSMDDAGAQVLASTADRLGSGALALLAPNSMVRRLLSVSGLIERVEQPAKATDHLGAEQTLGNPGVPVVSAPPAADSPRRVMAVPADDDVVDGALRLVVTLANATVGGAHGVSVSLRRHGRLATVAASDQTISDMDRHQYATGEGPCVDAFAKGRWFHVESLASESRWPAFTPKAQALGINAILSSPLMVRDRPVGALNIYSRRAGAFEPRDQELAALFATEASTILADAAIDVTEQDLAAHLATALQTRQVIAQAQGVLMARDQVDEDRAYTELVQTSCASGTPLSEVARAIVATALGAPRDGDDLEHREGARGG